MNHNSQSAQHGKPSLPMRMGTSCGRSHPRALLGAIRTSWTRECCVGVYWDDVNITSYSICFDLSLTLLAIKPLMSRKEGLRLCL